MAMIAVFMMIPFFSAVLIPFASTAWKGYITIAAVMVLALLSSIIAFRALGGTSTEILFRGSSVTGDIPVRIDALSGWFIIVINFTFITGALYGYQYMRTYALQKSNLSLHYISFIVAHSGLICVSSLQNSLAFLVAWEAMALSCFLLIIFEHQKRATLNAGINFLIQSHIGIMFLTLGFIWVSIYTNSFDFTAITIFSNANSFLAGIALFLCFFIGFAIKAGFVPFHTWLPYAHPAAPSHVSGVMSGVIIKIGIYGILRMLLLIKTDYTVIGYFIFFISLISGIYGVMLAVIQHNLKRLLAYHSIENIGIIGMGIGIGCIGMGQGNYSLTVLGFAGALLHTLNHSLFKSLLFYGAGNVYQATHTMDIERLGGLSKKMPHTAMLFLIASLAICGLPPFNGFVSEFLIYNGMFDSLHGLGNTLASSVICGLFALALIGGLAMLCFIKAYGMAFLGTSRHHLHQPAVEACPGKLAPMYAILILIVSIGVYPSFFIDALSKPLKLFSGNISYVHPPGLPLVSQALPATGLYSAGFLVLAGLVYIIRAQVTRHKPLHFDATWGCGYTAPAVKMQYTASSFVRAFRKLAEPFLSISKKKKEIQGIYPKTGGQETHPYDKAELWLIDYPVHLLKALFNRFVFLQNGNLQFYILYGIVFISLVLGVPFLFDYIKSLLRFLNQL
ncbi:MAG TPA: proton-conducting transporter membrane subunit [Chitinophagaceae bacterium]|nr:proton-conducting transporter membrane subunit [Chitinophagaceae bacterium]